MTSKWGDAFLQIMAFISTDSRKLEVELWKLEAQKKQEQPGSSSSSASSEAAKKRRNVLRKSLDQHDIFKNRIHHWFCPS